MRRFLIAALLLATLGAPLVALAQTAVPKVETIPVEKDGRIVQLNPAELEPLTQYALKLRCRRGETMVLETEIAVVAGFQAVIESSNKRADGTQRFGSLIIVDPASGPGLPSPVYSLDPLQEQPAAPVKGGGAPLPKQLRVPPAVLDAAQQFVICGLRITVYCPRADSFEVEVSRYDRVPPELVQYPGELVPKYIMPPEAAWVYAGRLSAALHTPDVGFAEVPPAAQ